MLIASLKDQNEFNLVSKRGKKFHTSYFILVLAKNFTDITCKPINTIFFGMKVTKKLGKAVVRNKIKRRIRHLMRLISKVPSFNCYNWGISIIPKKGFDKVQFSVLLNELQSLLQGALSN